MTEGVHQERRLRIRLSLAAYAYEVFSDPIMSDAEYDRLSQEVDLTAVTGRDDLDRWWRENFSPDTSLWIHKHPEKQKLEALYRAIKGSRVARTLSVWESVLRMTLGQKKK